MGQVEFTSVAGCLRSAASQLGRSLLRAAAQRWAGGWSAYSRLSLVSNSATWALDWERRELAAIATALNTLSKHMADQATQRDPLWYMETLERAREGGWLLATEEVEQLIGVKPSSSGKEDPFDRGGWRFVKAEEIGAQIAWRVEKLYVASQ